MRNALPSVMKHDFAVHPLPKVMRSKFDLSHGHTTTMDAGILYPICWEEVLPGDTHSVNLTAFARFLTLLRPIMDNIFFDVHFFFVPTRLVWDNWVRLNGERTNPDDSIDYIMPVVKDAAVESETLTVDPLTIGDYLGLPTIVEIQEVDLPRADVFRSYNLIYNEWYRAENLQDSLMVPKGDGPDPYNYYSLQRRGKRFDYFTQANPWPQKGEAVTLNISGYSNVPVVGTGDALGLTTGTDNFGLQVSTADLNMRFSQEAFGFQYGNAVGTTGATVARTAGVTLSADDSGLVALTSQLATNAVTIQELRTAFAIQQLLEQDARGGTRYTEIIRTQYGVAPLDARLQRPEFLGGGSVPTKIVSVPQTSATETGSPQANLTGYGQVTAFSGFHRSFEEHGIIMGIASIRADMRYQQGMDRKWSRKTRYDFYTPLLQGLGEQAVLNKEIYYDFDGALANQVFGYVPRWDEYRYANSHITGAMRSNYPLGSLDSWHLGLDFEATPLLNSDFIRDYPPVSRVVAVANQPHFNVDLYFKWHGVRPLPMNGIPGLRRL